MTVSGDGLERPLPLISLWHRAKSLAWRYTGVISVVVFLLAWEAYVEISGVHEILLPPPSAVGLELIEVSNKGLLWGPLFDSMKALATGLGIGLLGGVILGVLTGTLRALDLLSSPYLYALRATPRIAIAPLIVIWVGLGFGAKVTMVTLSAGTITLLIIQEAVKTLDQSLIRVAQSFSAKRRSIYFKVVMPSLLPAIANAIRNGVATGIVGLLVVEMFSASGGLGSQVSRADASYDSPRLFAFIFVLLALSLSLITLSRRLEDYVSKWREEAYV